MGERDVAASATRNTMWCAPSLSTIPHTTAVRTFSPKATAFALLAACSNILPLGQTKTKHVFAKTPADRNVPKTENTCVLLFTLFQFVYSQRRHNLCQRRIGYERRVGSTNLAETYVPPCLCAWCAQFAAYLFWQSSRERIDDGGDRHVARVHANIARSVLGLETHDGTHKRTDRAESHNTPRTQNDRMVRRRR